MIRSLHKTMLGVPMSLVLAVSVTTPALAQSSWAVAERDDGSILQLVSKLQPYVEKAPGQADAPAVVLYKQNQYNVKKRGGKTTWVRNYVLEVRDPDRVLDEISSPTFRADFPVKRSAGFVVHRGEVRRLADSQMELLQSPSQILRDEVRFEFGEVQSGDVVGWSISGEHKGIAFGDHFAVGDLYPIVIANMKVAAGGAVTYVVDGRGVARKDLEIDEKNVENGRPSLWSATLRGVPAQESTYAQGPFPDDYPHLWFYQDESYMEDQGPMPDGWMKFQGWNLMAMFANAMVVGAEKKADRVESVAERITKTNPDLRDREMAIFEYVRDEIDLLIGDRIERKGFRSPDEILEAGEGNAMEKCLLMVAMMDRAGCGGGISLLRDPDYGDLDPNAQTIVQFSDMVVRSRGEQPRFYAPQCTDCDDATLPSDWRGVQVFTVPEDLSDTLKKYQEALTKQFGSGSIPTPAGMAKNREAQHWYAMETIPGS